MTLGYLTKDPVTRRYSLSVRLLDFAHHYLASNELVQRAAPYLQQLSQETEEACNLSVLDGVETVFVLRFVSRHSHFPQMVGSRLPAYCTASGLAILSTFSSEEVGKVLAASRLIQHTPHTVVAPGKIKARLQRA
ncbi:hypothetical protein LP417_18505 [Polaromonas sp. P1-6]|nr:hypothetical protein LP417_18505 [Polaromonas sp. P1-6]